MNTHLKDSIPPYLAIILRHRRERLKKCSLKGLENRGEFKFFTYPLPPTTAGYCQVHPHTQSKHLRDTAAIISSSESSFEELLIKQRPRLLSFEGERIEPALDRPHTRVPFKESDQLNEQRPLLLIDGTWRLAQKMSSLEAINSLDRVCIDPLWKTAYPRRQDDCSEPSRGLASVEALYAALLQMYGSRLTLLRSSQEKATIQEEDFQEEDFQEESFGEQLSNRRATSAERPLPSQFPLILSHYQWAENFLSSNSSLIKFYS